MKQNKLRFTLALAALVPAALVMTGCKDANVGGQHNCENKLYVSSGPVCSDLLITPEYSSTQRQITVRLAMPATEDVTVTFAARPELAAQYCMMYGDIAGALPEAHYNLPDKSRVIVRGDVSTEGLTVEFVDTDKLDANLRYVLPVVVSSDNIGLLESARTVYFVFKGAALVNVVANIWGMNFPINWSDEAKEMVTGMTAITIEALVRSSNWEGGRGNPLSTVFGIEGYFLVRVGDANFPRNQVQLVSPHGNWPAADPGKGLPVDRFVHVALVYDTATQERIQYIDGVMVAYEQGVVSKPLTLHGQSNGCYIGYAWEDSRWMPGEMSELRVWNHQRTAEQIAKNPYYVDPASEGLVAYWKFNEGTGKVIRDHTGHGTDLTGVAADGSFPNGEAFSDTPVWVPVTLPAPQK
jgi:hypothetical protein